MDVITIFPLINNSWKFISSRRWCCVQNDGCSGGWVNPEFHFHIEFSILSLLLLLSALKGYTVYTHGAIKMDEVKGVVCVMTLHGMVWQHDQWQRASACVPFICVCERGDVGRKSVATAGINTIYWEKREQIWQRERWRTPCYTATSLTGIIWREQERQARERESIENVADNVLLVFFSKYIAYKFRGSKKEGNNPFVDVYATHQTATSGHIKTIFISGMCALCLGNEFQFLHLIDTV